MVKIFISYSVEDDELTESLKDILEEMKIFPVEVIKAPIIATPSKPFIEKISQFLDISDIFIPVITESSLNNIWVNQEIGYAFCLARKYGVKIIPIVHDRSKLEAGFINKEMDLPFVLNSDPLETFKDVRDFIDNKMDFPVTFNISRVTPRNRITRDYVESIFSINIFPRIENCGDRLLHHLHFGIVLPKEIKLNAERAVYFSGSSKIPKTFQRYFEGDIVYFYRIYDELYPNDIFEPHLIFEWDKELILNEMIFGVIIDIFGYGKKLYKNYLYFEEIIEINYKTEKMQNDESLIVKTV